MKLVFRLAWLALIVTACQALPTASPTVPLTYIPTPTMSHTPTPTLTPYPPLAQQGPYLMYAKYPDGHGPLTIVDASLHGRKIVELPENGSYSSSLKHVVSPDGKWLAFYTGSVIEPPYDLALNLLSLPDGVAYPITKLFSSAYPKDLQPVDDFYAEQGHGQESFKNGIGFLIETLAWSPDGRYLAFAGQMDGPSSDLYIYDVQTKKIRRLTDDLYVLADGIAWSPDGKWLLINEVVPGALHAMHRIRADGDLVKSLPILETMLEGTSWFSPGWISPTIYLMANRGDQGDLYNLRYLDVETGKIHQLWDSSMYLSYAINPQDKTIAVNGIVSQTGSRAQFGTFIVSLDGGRTPLSHDVDWVMGFLGGKTPFFLGESDKNLVTFDNVGFVHVEKESGYYRNTMLASPDNQWFVFFDKWYGVTPLVLFSADGKQKKIFSNFDSRWVLWRGDSLGFFVVGAKSLHYIALPYANLIELDWCLEGETACEFSNDLVWLP